MKKHWISLLGMIFLVTLSCREADIGPSYNCTYASAASSTLHPKNAVFQSILDTYVKNGLPGISTLIKDEDGVWVGYAGKADIDKNIPFTPCHASKAASITKFMVGTLTFMLQEQGLIDINDPIAKHIDADIISKVKNADQVTIKNCLQHTTGIYDIITDAEFYLAVLNNPNKQWRADELLELVYDKDPYFAPNEGVEYSNTNTIFVGMCLDKVLGYSHAKALREMIWDPLAMYDTYYQSRDLLPSTVAQGYYDLYNNNTIVNVSNLVTGSGNGYGGVFSTVYDLQKFMNAYYFDKTLVNEESMGMMMTFVSEGDMNNLGVGIMQKFKNFSPHLGLGHSGRDLGYSADLFVFPTRNDRQMIFFVNYGTDGDSALREVFREFEKTLVLEVTE
ncbi:D-alanyl-D-alanine carboxypeptidase [Catalinimonas alkaloidigena]|uniref:serine hydrolase domain-containing protein n=1 Tax=Catalinimonas alkaloidigena TaxID=1075417 RepID=UPI002405BA06|nr:serine hydrolase domain-containing protein [Catalinimonas alkaloidigena]MDF9797806.1 D-alanyl-D-alanine carboxypeptidase [Catalinimonas alkaloidigena]